MTLDDSIGDMEFYRFGNGTSTTRSQMGDMNFDSEGFFSNKP